MTDAHNDVCSTALVDATKDLNALLLEGTHGQRLMRVFALRELVGCVAPELLLKLVASLDLAAPAVGPLKVFAKKRNLTELPVVVTRLAKLA
jgi:hypothetical protein